jgi:glutathione S-transferase
MKIYVFPVAPNPTKVRLYLAEKATAGTQIDCEEVTVSLPQGEQNAPEHLARNPMGRIPVLELDDGSFLIESLPIIHYLEELYPDPPMIGTTPLERARVLEIERIADIGVLYAGARIVHATNSPLRLPPMPEVASYFEEVVDKNLAALDERMADGRPFLAGDRPSIADCTLAAGLQFMRFRELGIDPKYENLNRWDAEFRARPTAQSVLVL